MVSSSKYPGNSSEPPGSGDGRVDRFSPDHDPEAKTISFSDKENGDVLQVDPESPAKTHPPKSDSFSVSRKIGEGGNGVIWEAVQHSLGRAIALKSLKQERIAEASDSTQLKRIFHQEARLTAFLEHPNIVPVHDLGEDENGLPLLAMKLLDGRKWSHVIQDDYNKLSADDFYARHLQILMSVCNAVAFAHSHGVIHRDLKPAQVMIGNYGEVQLMDWGLAMTYNPMMSSSRALGKRAPAMNHMPNPAGTPCYMAPEQTEKTTERLGPWTDVYLLGGILYELLSGRPPHDALSTRAAMMLASEGSIIPLPEDGSREIPKQLASLAMNAMAKDPADRIASVEEFLQGLRDYLSGSDQRRESMQMVEQVVELLASGTGNYESLGHCLNLLHESLIQWPGNQLASQLREETLLSYAHLALRSGDLKLARLQTERLNVGPDRDRLLNEIAHRHELERMQEQRLTEALFQAKADRDRAEGLLHFILGDLYRELKKIGRPELLKLVTEQSLEYLDSLASSDHSDEAQLTRCRAYLNIGNVLTDEGQKSRAEEIYVKACSVARTLVGQQPECLDWLMTYAECHDKLGQTCYRQGRTGEALDHHVEALETLNKALFLRPGDIQMETSVAATRHAIGVVHWRVQNLALGLEWQTRSLKKFRQLLTIDPSNADIVSGLGWNLSTLANVYRDMGQLDQAIAVSREGLAIREKLLAQQPQNPSRKDDALWTRSNLAMLLLMNEDLEDSLKLFYQDLPIASLLYEQDPDNVNRLNGLTFILSFVGQIEFMLEHIDPARRAVSECVTLTERALQIHPKSTHLCGCYARQCQQLGEVLAAEGQWDLAAEATMKGLTMASHAASLAPKNAMLTKTLARLLTQLAFLHRIHGETSEVSSYVQRARELLSGIDPKSDELDVLDNRAQLCALENLREEFERICEELNRRRWLSPYLKRIANWVATGKA